jgi:hypothetical protein
MSVPHTGKLVAIVRGLRCEFDGNTWQTPSADLTSKLNEARQSAPTTHYTILCLARHILNSLGLLESSQIVSVEYDRWQSDLPDGAID